MVSITQTTSWTDMSRRCMDNQPVKSSHWYRWCHDACLHSLVNVCFSFFSFVCCREEKFDGVITIYFHFIRLEEFLGQDVNIKLNTKSGSLGLNRWGDIMYDCVANSFFLICSIESALFWLPQSIRSLPTAQLSSTKWLGVQAHVVHF